MTGIDVAKHALTSTEHLLLWFLEDLSDADLLVRPVPGANHIAWQLGHLINSEVGMHKPLLPGVAYPELPAGFKEQHSKDTASSDAPQGFRGKQEYQDLFQKARAATVEAVGRLSDADLDRPNAGNVKQFAPTLGALLMLTANHTMMHTGQFSAVRRKLGKRVLF